MFLYTTIAVILCATLALTSSPVTKPKTDRGAAASGDNENVFSAENLHVDDARDSSITGSPATSDKRDQNETRRVLMSEGGPIYRPGSVDSSPYLVDLAPRASFGDTTRVEASRPDSAKTKLPKTRNASVVARKGVPPDSKITPRKGVGAEAGGSSRESTSEGLSDLASVRTDVTDETLHPLLRKSENIGVESTSENKTWMDRARIVASNSTSRVSPNETRNGTRATESPAVTTAEATPATAAATTTKADIGGNATASTVKKLKPKPRVTIGEMDIDKPIPASPTKTPPLGMPRKIDYIIPVMITIIALPLLGGGTFLLYRRGRDCWDKRHYRRMDFLIDGMYNDYSWK